MLEHHADAATQRAQLRIAQGRQIVAVDHHAPGARPFQPVDEPQQRRLAGAGLPDDAEHAAAPDAQVERMQRHGGRIARAVTLRHSFECDQTGSFVVQRRQDARSTDPRMVCRPRRVWGNGCFVRYAAAALASRAACG